MGVVPHYLKHNLCFMLCTDYCLAGPKIAGWIWRKAALYNHYNPAALMAIHGPEEATLERAGDGFSRGLLPAGAGFPIFVDLVGANHTVVIEVQSLPLDRGAKVARVVDHRRVGFDVVLDIALKDVGEDRPCV